MNWWWKMRKKGQVLKRGAMVLEDLIECCDGKSNPIKFFSADEILKATNNFSHSNHVYVLNLGCHWYSGKNENHPMILIKKDFGVESYLGLDRLLCRDIAVSSMVSGHKNFLKLVGCCLEFEYPAMIYNGVKKHYPLEISEQTWKRRMKIAEDIATALAYLHNAFPRPFVYRTLSLNNILLDEDGVAKLTDFSYCVSIPEGETFVRVDRDVGLYNFRSSGVVSEKTDVFAFGIFMGHRLLLGNESFFEHYRGEEEESEGGGSDTDHEFSSAMDRQAQTLLSELTEDFADIEMLDKMDEISEQEFYQIKAFRMLSLRCIGRKGEVPTMVEVAKELKMIQKSLINDSSSSFSGETQFNSPQDISHLILVTNQT